MSRQSIISAVCMAAEELGYQFVAASSTSPRGAITQLPSLVLMPLRIVATEGRKEPFVTYHLSLLFLSAADFHGLHRESLWQLMERDALELFRRIEASPSVRSVGAFSATPNSRPRTPLGDCSLSVEFELTTRYCLD